MSDQSLGSDVSSDPRRTIKQFVDQPKKRGLSINKGSVPSRKSPSKVAGSTQLSGSRALLATDSRTHTKLFLTLSSSSLPK